MSDLKTKHPWPHIAGPWLKTQTSLDHLRWSQYQELYDVPAPEEDRRFISGDGLVRGRKTNCLEHSLSMVILGMMVAPRVERHLPRLLDKALLYTTLGLHDLGEGALKSDVLFQDKTIERDVQEYLAFCEGYRDMHSDTLQGFKRAFLLQFALGDTTAYPADAQQIMAILKVTHRYEALLFMGLEHWDYLLYALEQYQAPDRHLLIPLIRVIVLSTPYLDQVANELPGFREKIWTDEARGQTQEFLQSQEVKDFLRERRFASVEDLVKKSR